jgi:hypothetical protein
VQLDGVSGENAAKWSQLYNHNFACFGNYWQYEKEVFEFRMRKIFPPNKDGTDCRQYCDLYELFYNDEEG